ncbi:MAG: sensor histidine kinase [Sphingomonas sp.]|uniref:sensor histidine kinase n=1 Tax=Sphingomonas sp. TaxID=28214 RepID=UPI0030F89BBC
MRSSSALRLYDNGIIPSNDDGVSPYLGLLADCAARILCASDTSSMLNALFESVRVKLNLSVYFCYRYDGRNGLILEEHGGLTPTQSGAASHLALGQGPCGLVAADRAPHVFNRVRGSKDARLAYARAIGLAAYVGTPLMQGDTLLGTLGFGRKATMPFSRAEVQFLRAICSFVAIAKNRLRTELTLWETTCARDALAVEQTRLVDRIATLSRLSDTSAVASTLAHEMTQPLTAAANYIASAEMALGGLGDADILRRLVQARTQITRSAQIIAKARQLVETGTVANEHANLCEVLSDSLELALADHDGAAPAMIYDIDPSVTALVGDGVQITQVMTNLLRNAATALRGVASPTITVSCRRTQDGTVEIGVIDNGPGFDPEADSARFHQRATSTTGGLGIGLSVCRSIVAAHHGRIRAENTAQGGAAVYFTLPGQ